jgi:uncharacterized protein
LSEPPRPLYGLGDALAGYIAGFVISAITVAIVDNAVGYHAGRGQAVPLAVLAASAVGLWVGLAGAPVVVSWRKGTKSLARDFGLRVGAWWDIPAGLAIGAVAQYALIPLLYLPAELVDPHIRHRLSQPAQQDTGAVHSQVALTLALLLLAVGAPIVEELFFRGLLLRSLLVRTSPPLAIIASALLFALAHFEALQFAGLAAFGVVLGALAWRTGRLAPGIAAHAAFNAGAVITLTHLR